MPPPVANGGGNRVLDHQGRSPAVPLRSAIPSENREPITKNRVSSGLSRQSTAWGRITFTQIHKKYPPHRWGGPRDAGSRAS